MGLNDDETPDGASPEHIKFMEELVDNVKLMLGRDPMVAAIGNEQNGVYCVLISINQFPPNLVMMAILSMITDKVAKDMAERHNELQMAMGRSASKFVN